MRVAVALVLIAAIVAGTLNLVAPVAFGDLNGLVLVQDDAVAPDYVEGQVVLVRTDSEYDRGDIVVFPFGDDTAIGRVEEGGPRSGYAIRADGEALPYPVRPTADAITGRVVLGLPRSISFVVAIVAAVPTWLLIVALVPLLVLWSPSQLRRRQEVARARDAFGTTAWEDAMAALRAYTATRVLDLEEDTEALPEWPSGDGDGTDDDGLWARTDAWWRRRRGRRVVVDGVPVPAEDWFRSGRTDDEADEPDAHEEVVDADVGSGDTAIAVAEAPVAEAPVAEDVADGAATTAPAVAEPEVDEDVEADEPAVARTDDAAVADEVIDLTDEALADVTDEVVDVTDEAGADVEPAPVPEAEDASPPTAEEAVEPSPADAPLVEDRPAAAAAPAEDEDLTVAARAATADPRVDVPVADDQPMLDPVGAATSGPVVPNNEPPRLLSGALTVLMLLLSAVAGFYAVGRLGSEGDTITTVSGLQVGVGSAVTAAALTSLGLLVLAGVVFWYGFLRTPWDRYATLYWWLIAEIPSQATLDGPHRELDTIQELIAVAQKDRRTVLHQRRPDGTHRWLVQTPDVVLSHTLVPTRPEDDRPAVPSDLGVLVGRDEGSGRLIRHVADLDEFVDAYAGHDDVDVVEQVLDDGTSRLSVVVGDLVLVHDVIDRDPTDEDREGRTVVHSAAHDEGS